jgi:hypothetical protein
MGSFPAACCGGVYCQWGIVVESFCIRPLNLSVSINEIKITH